MVTANIIPFPTGGRGGNGDGGGGGDDDGDSELNQDPDIGQSDEEPLTIAEIKQYRIDQQFISLLTEHRGDTAFLGPLISREVMSDYIGKQITEEEFIAITVSINYWVNGFLLPVVDTLARDIYNRINKED